MERLQSQAGAETKQGTASTNKMAARSPFILRLKYIRDWSTALIGQPGGAARGSLVVGVEGGGSPMLSWW